MSGTAKVANVGSRATMTEATIVATIGAFLALTLTGCSAPAPTASDPERPELATALKASDPAVTDVLAHTYQDVVTGSYYLDVAVTLGADDEPTPKLMKALYDAALESTPEGLKSETISLWFDHEGERHVPLPLADVCEAAGLQDPYMAGAYCLDNTFNVVPNPDVGGYPGTPNALGVSYSLPSQRVAWIDAVEASNADVESVSVRALMIGSEGQYYLDATVTLRPDANLTYDSLRGVYDAFMTSTSALWTNNYLTVRFAMADAPDEPVLLRDIVRDAGVTTLENATVSLDDFSMLMLLTPRKAEFPGPDLPPIVGHE